VTEPHPETALLPYLRGELEADERRRVETHLAGCQACHATASDFQVILDRLAATVPPAPEPHWGQYRAELRARLDAPARRGWSRGVSSERHGRSRGWSRWLRPIPVAMAAAVTAAVVLTLTVGERGTSPNGDVASLEEAALAAHLDMLDKRAIVERLDLLEDLEVIHDLDRLAGTRAG
jgi:anti-sigma factor RsiW